MNESKLYKIKHILILSKALADEVSQRLSEGGDFEDLAIECSACPSAQYAGSLGWMKLEEFPESLHEGIRALTLQHWEGPFKSTMGYHFFQLEHSQMQAA